MYTLILVFYLTSTNGHAASVSSFSVPELFFSEAACKSEGEKKAKNLMMDKAMHPTSGWVDYNSSVKWDCMFVRR